MNTIYVSILCGEHVIQNKVGLRLLGGTKEQAAEELLEMTKNDHPNLKLKYRIEGFLKK